MVDNPIAGYRADHEESAESRAVDVSMITLLYVSVSRLSCSTAAFEVADIVERSIDRNAGLSVTGALLFTGTHFVQALEGSGDHVSDLMESIRRDSRHQNVTVVDQGPISCRRFASWNLAYQGVAGYVAQPITRLLSSEQDCDRQRHVDWIYRLMTEFVRT